MMGDLHLFWQPIGESSPDFLGDDYDADGLLHRHHFRQSACGMRIHWLEVPSPVIPVRNQPSEY
jgi:hypothetical protein